ncbi:MAG: ferredoxin [Rhodobacteraceae bacterium]|nr:ferredoxin [Paracoccaceae bacterium]
MTYQAVKTAANAVGLDIFGAFHPRPDQRAPEGCGTLLLLGPDEPGFWDRITNSAEYHLPDPVDRWSERVIGRLAADFGAKALFPFGGPPYQPFVSWALGSGRVWQSPVGLLVHDRAGLMVSFRGALALPQRLVLPALPANSPCENCITKPCLDACPAGALNADGYQLAVCHDWLDSKPGKTCMNAGCLVRRACPPSQSYGRLAEQSAHHMRFFHKG